MEEELGLLCLDSTLVSTNGKIKIQAVVLHIRTWKGQNNDAGLQAAVASVRTDDGPTEKRNDFEAAATQLLAYDPVAKRRLRGTKRGAGMISSVMNRAEDVPDSKT
jgi:hypothetical protein